MAIEITEHRPFMLSLFLLLFLLQKVTPLTSAMLLLEGKRIFVTGAGRGIGRAIALTCHQEEAKVAISSRTTSELEDTAALAAPQTVRLSGGSSISKDRQSLSSVTCVNSDISVHVADVTKKKDVETIITDVVGEWGGIDILINNAGGAQSLKGPVDSLEDEVVLSALLNLNVHLVINAVTRLNLLWSLSI